MYLLDNHKNNLNIDILKQISNVNSIKELTSLSVKEFDGIQYFLDKVKFGFKSMSQISNTKTSKENIKNLFINPPLSLDENSNEYKNILNKYYDLKNPIKLYPFDSFFNDYKELLLKKINENDSKTSYELVGEITTSFSKLFYGSKVINKHDMNILLYGVNEINPKDNEINKDFDKNEFLAFIYDLYSNNINLIPDELSELLLVSNDKLELSKIMPILQLKLTELNNELVENKYRTEIKNLKQITFNHIKNGFINHLNDKGINDFPIIDKLLVNGLTSKEILEALKDISKNTITRNTNYEELLKSTNNPLIQTNLKDSIENYNNLKTSIDNAIPILENIIKTNSEKYVKDVNRYFVDNDFNIFENNVKDIKIIDDKPKYKIQLEKFQSFNKIFLNNQSIDKIKYINNEIIKTTNIKDSKSIFINNINLLINSNIDIKLYNINEIKQLFYILLSNNKNVYNLLSTTDLFVGIENNALIKNLIENKSLFPQFDVNRLKYVFDIVVYNKDIESLFKTELNLNIKDMFFTRLGLSMDSKDGMKKLNEVFKIFKLKNESLNIKNQNILLGIILYSYENKEFNESKFLKLIDTLNTSINRMNPSHKNTINSIDNNWLKWSITYNREIKDNNLIISNINPINFEFSNIQTIKKILKEITNKDVEFSKYDYNFYQFYLEKNGVINKENIEKIFNINSLLKVIDSKNMRNINNEIESLTNSMENMTNFKNDSLYESYENLRNDKTKMKNNSMYYLFNRSLENVLTSKNEFIINKLNKIDMTSTNSFVFVNEVIALSKLNNFINDDRIDLSKININSIYNIIKDNKDIGSSLKGLPIDLYTNILKNIEAIPKMTNNSLKRYIDYFKIMSETDSFKNFKESDSLIPLLEKDLGNGYSYKVKSIKDFDILLTGEKTDNCMSYNSAGWNIFKHMYENPKSNVIFEIYKDGKAVANSWTWVQDNQLTFDNIEVLGTELRENVIHAYRDVSLEFIKKIDFIDKVTFGVDYTDIDVKKLGMDMNYSDYNKLFSNCYSDSGNQKLILTNKSNIVDTKVMMEKLNESKQFVSSENLESLNSIVKDFEYIKNEQLNFLYNNINNQNNRGQVFPNILETCDEIIF